MLRHVCKRTAVALLTIYLIITLNFFLIHWMPGDPLIHLVGQEEYYYLLDASPETLTHLADQYGLNASISEQYLHYLHHVVTLNFGESYINHYRVWDNVIQACGWTLLLSLPTLIIGGLLGACTGIWAGWRPGRLFDRCSTPLAIFINTLPSNGLALLLLVLFAFHWRLCPINGMVSTGVQGSARLLSILSHMILPLAVLISSRSAYNFLLMKSTVSQIRQEAYTLTAQSKGLPARTVLFRHVLRNALLPYTTTLFVQMGALLSGAMVVEVVFGWKGMGRLFYEAVQTRDFPTAQLCFLISAITVVISALLSDLLNTLLDPRVKKGGVYA